MCKVFAMTNVSNVKMTQDFLNIVKESVTKTVDKDGFGYAVSTSDGQLWGERTTKPTMFNPLEVSNFVQSVTSQLPIAEVINNSFGPIASENNVSFIAHGRMSTNQVNIQNTHPFVSDNIALIHNGVVSDPNGVTLELLKTTCDTEILMHLWDKNGIEAIEENAAGYYAMAILDKLGQLHIVKDDRASLFVAYSPTVDSFLFATTIEILEDIAARMNWKIEKSIPVMNNVYAVFQGNECVYNQEIFTLGYVHNFDDSKVSAALGEQVDALEHMTSLAGDDAPYDDDSIDYDDVVDLMYRRAKH